MTTDRRIEQIEDFHRLESKVDKVEEELTKLAIKLSDDHTGQHDYIKKAMEREARREELHRAIIEKTLAALIWSAIVGLGGLIYGVISSHWH